MTLLSLKYSCILFLTLGQTDVPDGRGTNWQTLDKAISVVIPEGFEESPISPEELAGQPGTTGTRWHDPRNGGGIAVLQTRIPSGGRIDPTDVVGGFTKGLGGTLLQSITEKVDGYMVSSTSVSNAERNVSAKQRVFVTATNIYQLTALDEGDAQDFDPRIDQFLASLRINQAAIPSKPVFPIANRPMTLNELSGKLGFYGLVLLVICAFLKRDQRNKKKRRSEVESLHKPLNEE